MVKQEKSLSNEPGVLKQGPGSRILSEAPAIVDGSRATEPLFDEEGNVAHWEVAGHHCVEMLPVRQNGPRDFRGIELWVKSAPQERAGSQILSFLESKFVTIRTGTGPGWTCFERTGLGWKAFIRWEWEAAELRLMASLENGTGERCRQLELCWWLPFDLSGHIESFCGGKRWNYRKPEYGRVTVRMMDRDTPLRYVCENGIRLELQDRSFESRGHIYHRGLSLKLGTASAVALPETNVALECSASLSLKQATRRRCNARRHPLPELRGRNMLGQQGLMLHLQYTGLSGIPDLLRRWFQAAARLGFDWVMLELDRGLHAHPLSPPWAITWATLKDLATAARSEGLELIPMYNLLGHQWETGILDWRREWQETEFSGLCPSHLEVREFSRDLILRLADACSSRWVHIGGDELKFPGDGRDGLVCPRCGESPNLREVIAYWNALQEGVGDCIGLAVWGDQLLPPDAVEKGLQAHNWDGRGGEWLEMLDRRVRIFDWQYGTTSPESSLAFLSRMTHDVSLASASEYSLETPFIHARLAARGLVRTRLHTTWASPHPADMPLEGILAAAFAGVGEAYHARRTAVLCARYARGLFDFLTDP